MLEKQSKTKQNKTKKASKLSVQKEEQQKKDPTLLTFSQKQFVNARLNIPVKLFFITHIVILCIQ